MTSILESLGARRSVEESTTTADGGGSGERLATKVADVMEMPGATVRAAESSEAEARAVDVVSKSAA